MMTKENMIEMVKALGNDADMTIYDDVISVTINDFEGFDDDWHEIERQYDDSKAVTAFEDMLEDEAIEYDGDFYTYYYFEGFTVKLGYGSFDI